jgi:hypothetical protein
MPKLSDFGADQGLASLVGFIGDGRSGLSAAATTSGASAAKPVGNTTGGHPVIPATVAGRKLFSLR